MVSSPQSWDPQGQSGRGLRERETEVWGAQRKGMGAVGLNYIQFTGMEIILFPLFVEKWCLARLVFPIYCTKKATSILSLHLWSTKIFDFKNFCLPFSLRIILLVLVVKLWASRKYIELQTRIFDQDFEDISCSTSEIFRLKKPDIFSILFGKECCIEIQYILYKWNLKYRVCFF